MYAATTKDEGNAADGRFSTACKGLLSGELTITKNGVVCQPERPRGKCFLKTDFSRMMDVSKKTFNTPFPLSTEAVVFSAILFESLGKKD